MDNVNQTSAFSAGTQLGLSDFGADNPEYRRIMSSVFLLPNIVIAKLDNGYAAISGGGRRHPFAVGSWSDLEKPIMEYIEKNMATRVTAPAYEPTIHSLDDLDLGL